MPYAPGVQSRVGDYLASVGPQIQQNLQLYVQNKREREQAQTAAETLGRLLDPEGQRLFGEELGKLPSASTGAAKGTLGAVTMYLTQQQQLAQNAPQRELASEQVAALKETREAEKSERESLSNLGQMIAARPADSPDLTLNQFIRMASQAGALGSKNLGNVLRELGDVDKRLGVDKEPQIKTKAGVKYAWSDWTGQFQLVPGEVGGAEGTLIPLKTPDGEIYAWGVRTPKGAIVPVAPPRDPNQLRPADAIRAQKELAEVMKTLDAELVRNKNLEGDAKVPSNLKIKRLKAQRAELEAIIKRGQAKPAPTTGQVEPALTDEQEQAAQEEEDEDDEDEELAQLGQPTTEAPLPEHPGYVIMINQQGEAGYVLETDRDEALRQGLKLRGTNVR